jgi:hypothetical protein
VIVGLILYLINNYLPLQPPFPMIINVVVIIFLIIWLLQLLGAFSGLHDIRIGR